MAYNTGNPIGSLDPRDAADNKENFDRFALSTARNYTDRLGVKRKTVTGTLQDYAAYNSRGVWTTATAYNVNDIWRDGPAGAFYLVLADYTSGATAAADIASGNVTVQQPKDWVVSVATIADLRAMEPAFDGQQVELLGHTIAGIGGGMFYADYSSSAADDNGVTVVTTVGRRWVRKFDGALDIKYFGAIGDSVADDTAPIQAALDSAITMKRAVYVSSGIHRTTAQITIPKNPNPGSAYGVTLYGDSHIWSDASVILAEHTGPAVLSLKGSNGSSISGIKLASDPVTFPKCGLVLGRDANIDSCGWHNIRRIWVDGNFSVAGIYSIASEENIWTDIFIQLRGGGAKYGFYTSVSDGLLVDALPASTNLANTVRKMNIWNWQAIPDSACVYLETAESMGSWSFIDCYCIPKSGSYYQINCGAIDATSPLGPFSFTGCGGEIYAPTSPYLDTPDNVFRISSVANLKLPGLTILGSRGQLINAGGTRKILNVDSNLSLIKPNIVLQPLEDPTIGYSVYRGKIEGGIFDVADSSAWRPLALSGAWSNHFGAPYAAASFQVDNTGTLRLRGNINNGGAGVGLIATLPPGYEPQYNAQFSTQDNGVNATITVNTNGDISMVTGTGNNLNLNQVVFKLRDA